MCKHCCCMKRTPCEPIPYACPLCPVRKVTKHCNGKLKKVNFAQQEFGVPTLKQEPDEEPTELCKEISDLYSYMVELKRNVKRAKRRREKQEYQEIAQKNAQIKALPYQQIQKENQIPVLYWDKEYGLDASMWKPRFPLSEEKVHERIAGGASGRRRKVRKAKKNKFPAVSKRKLFKFSADQR